MEAVTHTQNVCVPQLPDTYIYVCVCVQSICNLCVFVCVQSICNPSACVCTIDM